MRHAVIMAGGPGTRLWPLTRRSRPKQLLRLFNNASLLDASWRRLLPIFVADHIWVVTAQDYVELVAEELPDIRRENIIAEPTPRDTANAIGLAATVLARVDTRATMGVFTADHLISPQERFAEAIVTGLTAAEAHPDALVTFGITPDGPHTGYGYVQRGDALGERLYEVQAFKEKPTRSVAEQYLRSGEYFWNSGMFAWRCDAILAELDRCLPANAAALREIASGWPKLGGDAAAAARFAALPKISIDYGVMEKARRVLVVEMSCRWLDLGSWSAVAQTREPDEAGNVAIAPRSLCVGGGDNVIVSEDDHLIVTLGLSNVVVVRSEDVTLVCHKDHEQDIKRLAPLCKEKFGVPFD
jgi:mannose-1-phosphate guanylyltransferase